MATATKLSKEEYIRTGEISEISEIFEIRRGAVYSFGFTISYSDSEIVNVIRDFTVENRPLKHKEIKALHLKLSNIKNRSSAELNKTNQ